ncbi:copper-binding protein [Hyphomicrobium sp.]|uniref:copper-binding protein n=1 Tax=Hyphomicrobium sp. TaxID=82 RepID=UPI002E31AE24|nr:copper-binding protein [Hyphomicrobium sp.]HEX2841013.1 copper-binding protein [Hyphomicrobium sp.]
MIKTLKASALAVAMIALPFAALADAGGPMVKGEVTKVDESAGKITIKHEAIPNLEMDAMTMVFKTGEGISVKDVKSGDKVVFHADKVNGQITLTRLEKAK